MIARWFPHPILAVVLVFLWMFLQNGFSLGGLLMGCVLAALISRVTSNFWPARPPVRSRRKAFAFIALAAWDVVVANIQVSWLILFKPADQLKLRWITIPLELESPEAITILAGAITMTPGTVSSDFSADGRALLVHCLDAPDAEEAILKIKTRYEARLKEIF